MLGRTFSRREIDLLLTENAYAIEDLRNQLQELESCLNIEYIDGEYREKVAKRTKKVISSKENILASIGAVAKEFLSDKITMPKSFRVWDSLHKRWFQGGTDEKRLEHSTDNISFFGEIMVMEGTLFDQNEDDAWKTQLRGGRVNSAVEQGEVKSTLDLIEYLCVVQNTGVKDSTGRFIYEGDIIKVTDNVETNYHVVSYNKQTGSIDNLNSFNEGDSIEIVGNVFEGITEKEGE